MSMRPLIPAVIGLAVLSLIAFGQKAPKSTHQAGWTSDLAKAKAEAKRTGKHIMIDFNATWCGPCQLYKKDVFPTAEFKNAAKNFILVEIDTDEQSALAQKFGVNSIPDIRILNPNGKEVGRVVGYAGSKPLIAELAKARRSGK